MRLKLQILQLMADLFPKGEMDDSSIDKLGDGSFNIVVAISLKPDAQQRDSRVSFSARLSKFLGIPPQPRDFALRIPFDEDGELTGPAFRHVPRDIATQHIVSSHLTLPVSKIVKLDLHSRNALGRPYTLQTLLPGKNMHWLWTGLNQPQKMSAVQQITVILEKIAAMTSAAAGWISVSNLTSPSSSIALDQFPAPSPGEARRQTSFRQPSQRPAPHQTPCQYLVDHCERWQRYEEDTLQVCHNLKLWDALIAVVHALERRGWLGQEFHLAHGDLFPRNILAEVTSPTTVKITGIVDWDMACFAPKFVALRAPFWAWKGGFVDETDEDVATYESPAEDRKALREGFRREASNEFVRFGLSREGAIARKLFRVLSTGIPSINNRCLALELVEQWDALYPEDKLGDYEVI
ncbi:uncharacterized protein ALTATR162_LOCUS7099 [Alternaria atra]|uniref:Aminoglycoside phosphotransferase domain-containing protein n=1 Tax=Alternaria atra TaxID=119953 RepID=A0A8J2I7W8_9PLEO|nr:uncharacterized protein ALTATR162_LOCUS7099 [Alternaria atra]CAG5169905.1 unnamed protein product [Alternaria atra]